MDVVPVRCYIIGSSHITRLDKYIDKTERDGFKLNNYVVQLQGINGGFVNSIYKYLLDIKSFQPDIVFLQIGSNDIGDGNNSVSNVLVALELLIELLLSFKVKIVFFGLVPYRTRVLPRRGLTLHQYNERVYSLNYRFYNIVCKFTSNVVHWIHRGIQFPNVNILNTDGVHFNKEGNKRLFLSIRGALLYANSLIQGNYYIEYTLHIDIKVILTTLIWWYESPMSSLSYLKLLFFRIITRNFRE